VQQARMAFRILGRAFRDTWQEFWTILVIHLLFLLGTILILPGPPATLALFYYGNRIAHGEMANERDFLGAIRKYWSPGWRWGLINLLVIGLLTGDYYLIGNLVNNSSTAYFLQGLYITLLALWFLLQLFALPFLFEQTQPSVSQALRNSAVFIGKNLVFVLVLALLLGLSLIIGTLAFMLTFAFGGAFVAFASNRAVLKELAAD
jgi:magnesium-transporting ATPase (P-type)